MTILFTWPTTTDEWLTTEDAFFLRDRMWPTIAACLWPHAPVSLAEWRYLSLFDLRKSCAWFCICTPGKEVGLIMRLYTPKKEMHYKYLHKVDRLKVEIVHILVIITAMTQNHGNCRKSRHKAKIIVITAIVNSWFTYIPKVEVYTGLAHPLATIPIVISLFLKVTRLLGCVHWCVISNAVLFVGILGMCWMEAIVYSKQKFGVMPLLGNFSASLGLSNVSRAVYCRCSIVVCLCSNRLLFWWLFLQQLQMKNRQLKEIIDQLRTTVWEINTMMAMRRTVSQ